MTRSPARPHDSRVLLVGLVLPIAVTAVALGIVIAWLPELPETIVTHWGTNGPDGFGARATLPILLSVVGLGLPAVLGGLAFGTLRSTFGFGQKLLATTSCAVAVLVTVLFLGMAAVQRGIGDAHQARDLLPTFLIGYGSAIVVAVAAWWILPAWSRATPAWRASEPLPIGDDERAVWWGTARFPAWAIAAILIPSLAVTAVISGVAASRGGAAWLLLGIPVIMLVAVISSADWRIRVDAAGLRVRSVLGFPAWNIPVGDIAAAGTTSVAAVAEFGGWGVRWAGGRRIGVITRSGSALEVRRTDGRSLVVTVDDAQAAAALLTARIAARG